MTEAGPKAHVMIVFLNVKTAEKSLQYGANKCKIMIVGEDPDNILHSNLFVDKWVVEHEEYSMTGDTKLVETFVGQAEVEKCSEQNYLGFRISSSGNNMANIRAVKCKSIGISKKIFLKMNSMNFGKYYFEVGLIFLNVILRSSILHASETYYNLKENEIRNLERIEEGFMRNLLKMPKECPIIQLYCELGQVPARFEIIKLRLFFLKYILNQDSDSLIFRFLQLQIEKPVRFDWASTCVQDLKRLKLDITFDDIKRMPITQYKNIIRNKCKNLALDYLLRKRGSKGKEIQYKEIQTAEYLLPNNELTIEEQRTIFSIRNRMINIPSNFIAKEQNDNKCICNRIEDMKYTYECKNINKKSPEVNFEQIYNGTIYEQKKILRRFEHNLEMRTKLKENETNHVILYCDPLPPVAIGE